MVPFAVWAIKEAFSAVVCIHIVYSFIVFVHLCVGMLCMNLLYSLRCGQSKRPSVLWSVFILCIHLLYVCLYDLLRLFLCIYGIY